MLKSVAALTMLLLVGCSSTATETTIDTPLPTTPATTTQPIGTVPPWTPPPNPLVIEGDRFMDRVSGEEFVVRGVNYFLIARSPAGSLSDRFFSPLNFDRVRIRADFAELAGLGYNTVRIFLDGCSSGEGCIGAQTGTGLNPAYIDVIAEVMDIAADTGIMLLLTSNDLPDDGGYRDISGRGTSSDFAGYRNTDFLTKEGHEAMVTYWTDLLSALVDRQARFDTVLGWSILNEHWLFGLQPPLALDSGLVETASGTYDMSAAKQAMVVESTRAMIGSVAAAIRAVDPSARVTMGFFAPQFPNATSIGGDWYVDTAPLVTESDLDFFDFHFYAGSDITMAQAGENFGITDAKPVILGEYGAFVSDYPTASNLEFVIRDHMASSCAAGFDGWLYWGYLRAPLDDATWALTDNEGALLDSLSPASLADPCLPPKNPNLAARATITASRSLPEEPPTNVSDGSPAAWGSGADAPQFIEIDLGAEAAVDSIQLTVAQYPAGRTVHRLQWALEDGVFSKGVTFDQESDDNQILEYTWEPEPQSMRYLRITTTVSPSWVAWREITVSGVAAVESAMGSCATALVRIGPDRP